MEFELIDETKTINRIGLSKFASWMQAVSELWEHVATYDDLSKEEIIEKLGEFQRRVNFYLDMLLESINAE